MIIIVNIWARWLFPLNIIFSDWISQERMYIRHWKQNLFFIQCCLWPFKERCSFYQSKDKMWLEELSLEYYNSATECASTNYNGTGTRNSETVTKNFDHNLMLTQHASMRSATCLAEQGWGQLVCQLSHGKGHVMWGTQWHGIYDELEILNIIIIK